MKFLGEGQLVTVTDDDGTVDGIVFHATSPLKLEVAVPDKEHGAVFKTLHPSKLKLRTDPGDHDQALRKLIRGTPTPGRGGPRSGGSAVGGRRGHTRSAPHRSSGRGG